ncbi:MAG: hypothetical protein LBC63_02250 [Holophagales bacterium]|jgi:hypothetical protein|nr:hypothetical protein [Holophagales bacterium]
MCQDDGEQGGNDCNAIADQYAVDVDKVDVSRIQAQAQDTERTSPKMERAAN